MEFDKQAKRKIVLHSFKYPTSVLYGFLIGTDNRVTDVIPISHTNMNSCLLKTSLELVSRNLKKREDKATVLGIYDVYETGEANKNDNKQLRELLLKTIQAVFKHKNVVNLSMKVKDLTGNRPDYNNMTYKEVCEAYGNQVFDICFEEYRYEGELRKVNDVAFDLADFRDWFKIVDSDSIMDIEDHLDDIKSDFTNKKLN